MGKGLIDILAPRLPDIGIDAEMENEKVQEDRWVKIYDMRNNMKYTTHLNESNIVAEKYKSDWNKNANPLPNPLINQLCIVGEKVNIKYEKKLDQSFFKMQSAAFVNRVYRGYLGRKKARQLKFHDKAIFIQKYIR
jgi:hypothetical protein